MDQYAGVDVGGALGAIWPGGRAGRPGRSLCFAPGLSTHGLQSTPAAPPWPPRPAGERERQGVGAQFGGGQAEVMRRDASTAPPHSFCPAAASAVKATTSQHSPQNPTPPALHPHPRHGVRSIPAHSKPNPPLPLTLGTWWMPALQRVLVRMRPVDWSTITTSPSRTM
jgi:hypothetical protein